MSFEENLTVIYRPEIGKLKQLPVIDSDPSCRV